MLLFRYGSRHGGSKGTFRGEETDSAEALQERALALSGVFVRQLTMQNA